MAISEKHQIKAIIIQKLTAQTKRAVEQKLKQCLFFFQKHWFNKFVLREELFKVIKLWINIYNNYGIFTLQNVIYDRCGNISDICKSLSDLITFLYSTEQMVNVMAIIE